jgi:AbrB family looped-hinge helix DNA binding protein
MKRYISTITQRGQVTLPADARRLLGVGLRDKVAFLVEGDRVTLTRPAFTLETAFGSVKPWWQPEQLDEAVREAREDYRGARADREERQERSGLPGA